MSRIAVQPSGRFCQGKYRGMVGLGITFLSLACSAPGHAPDRQIASQTSWNGDICGILKGEGFESLACRPSVNWKNWTHTVQNTDVVLVKPVNVQQVQHIVRVAYRNNWKVRPKGSGHSFSQATQLPQGQILIDTHSLVYDPLIKVSRDNKSVTVAGGTKLKDLVDALKSHKPSLALHNLGSFQLQTVAGVVSTNTHGTGVSKTGFAGMVKAMKLVDGRGNLRELSAWATDEESKNLFRAALGGIGMVGIITELTLSVEPHFKIELSKDLIHIDELNATDLRRELRNKSENEWYSLFWPIAHDEIVVSKGRRYDARNKQNIVLSKKNHLVTKVSRNRFVNGWVFNRLSKDPEKWPEFFDWSLGFIEKGLKNPKKHKVFDYDEAISNRFVMKNFPLDLETEYFIPVQYLPSALRAIRTVYEDFADDQKFLAAPFVAVRFVKGDNAFLSSAYKYKEYDEFAALNVYNRSGSEPKDLFNRMQNAIQMVLPGRDPMLLRQHLGKINSDTPSEFRSRYLHWDDFAKARAESDPKNIFLNEWTEKFF